MAKLNVKNAVVQSAFIVTFLSVLERAFGFLYRVILSRKLGAEGMGHYYITLSVFSVFLSVAVSGIPGTVSRLSIKYRAEGQNKKEGGVISAGIFSVLLYGSVVCLLFVLLRKYLGFLFTDPRCVSLLLILSPGLIFCSVYAVLRAKFWGNSRFTAFAVIELIEEILLVALGSVFLFFANDAFSGAKLITLALTVASFCSFTMAIVLFKKSGGKLQNPKGTFKPLFASALPVTGMRVASSLTASLVAVVFPLRLIATGLSKQAAVSLYAAASAMAAPLLFAPCTVIGSISLVLVPKLSGEYYNRNEKQFTKTLSSALNAAVLLAFLLFPLLALGGKDLCLLLYKNEQAGVLVQRFALLVLPMTLALMSMSILNSMGKEKICMAFSVAGNVCMLLCALILPPYLGENALFLGYVFDYGVTALLNIIYLHVRVSPLSGVKTFALKNIAAGLPAVALGYFALPLFCFIFPRLFAVIVSVGTALVFQGILLITFGAIRFSWARKSTRKNRAFRLKNTA
ncbi:MAG: hypothetical protein E7363_03320 [Clostridiales bacterium]|nr:hypothetical protein [Clostridiales bacterium]